MDGDSKKRPNIEFNKVKPGIIWGAIFLAIHIGWQLVPWAPTDSVGKNVYDIVTGTVEGLRIIGLFLLCIGLFIYFGRGIIDVAVDLYFKPPLQRLERVANNGIKELVKAIPTSDEILCRIPKCEDIPSTKEILQKIPDGENLVEFMLHNDIHRYGKHSKNPESLYCYVNKMLLSHFCVAPHKSAYTKTIRLRPYPEDNNYFIWDESSTYRIHNPVVAENGPAYAYDFKIGTVTMYTEEDPEKWLNEFKLTAVVDGTKGKEDIIGDLQPVEYKSGEEQNYTWERRGNWIDVNFNKNILLNKEWTDVTTSERGLTPIVDQNYSLGVYTPYWGCEVTISLPNGYEFVRDTDCSVENLLKGLQIPQEEYDRYFKIRYLADNTTIKANIFGWALPGTAFNIQWRKI